MSPKTAAIIVAYNCNEVLGRCLAHVTGQTMPFDRIIVVDNSEHTKRAEQVAAGFAPIEYIANDTNLGFAAGNNQAIRIADGCEYVALINPDAFPEADWHERMLAAALEFPSHGSFASLMISDNGITVDGAGDVYHVSGLSWRRFHGMKKEECTFEREEVFAACAGAAFYRREAIVQAGLFDERYFCYHEDVDIGFRLQLNGHTCLFEPSAVVTHIGGATAGMESRFAIYHGHRNLEWTWYKNMPGPMLFRYILRHIMMGALTTGFYVAKGRGLTIIKAKLSAILRLPAVLWKRTRIKTTREERRRLRSLMDGRSVFSLAKKPK